MEKLFVKCMNLLCKFSMQCKIKKRLIPFVMFVPCPLLISAFLVLVADCDRSDIQNLKGLFML